MGGDFNALAGHDRTSVSVFPKKADSLKVLDDTPDARTRGLEANFTTDVVGLFHHESVEIVIDGNRPLPIRHRGHDLEKVRKQGKLLSVQPLRSSLVDNRHAHLRVLRSGQLAAFGATQKRPPVRCSFIRTSPASGRHAVKRDQGDIGDRAISCSADTGRRWNESPCVAMVRNATNRGPSELPSLGLV
jgi:hypothetical protein